ncbi:site-specific integrase [Pseudoxanthomonas sp. SGT-18]|uniref:site-specific integrase n=1 Tax=Pseudoxanthomonas sp. SGT-18 TaxID=2493087 RepID=UPI000F629557|nr:site-specific integrase [Pseudoxanthomonas sp. SGT-18]
MSDLARYLEAATRQNTQRSYASALRHFEVEWGGHLPATPDSVARYLAEQAPLAAINTLKQRLAALAHWHHEHGFVDPTRAPVVRKVLKGIQTLHARVEKQVTPLQLTQLTQVVGWLDEAVVAAQVRSDRAAELRYLRDKALLLLGFWRGFRGDELIRLQVEHLRIVAGEGMTCFLPRSKGDRQSAGNTYKVPALSRLCPVTATWEWIEAAALTSGPLFRGVDRWAHVSDEPLHPNSLIRLLRRLLGAAGLPAVAGYGSHSLRRGFAGWANDNGWDIKALMEYVGWRDVHSAMRYIQGSDPFSRHRVEASLQAPIPTPLSGLPPAAPVVTMSVTLRLVVNPFTPKGRGAAKARARIEAICLEPFQAHRLDAEGTEYRLTVVASDTGDMDELVATLLDDMHRIADNHQCFLEASLRGEDGRHWN